MRRRTQLRRLTQKCVARRQIAAFTATRVPVLRVDIVQRSDHMETFVVLPRRWMVEYTFSRFGRNRRFAKGLRKPRQNLGNPVTLASVQFALRRLVRA
jgi:transposase